MYPHRLKPGYAVGGWLPQIFASRPAHFSAVVEPGPNTDEFWMHEALKESLLGSGLTNPNPSVGCVIVKDGRELSRGHTEAYRGKHAERVAIEKILDPKELVGATIYVTLEPCAHFGNQPPCCNLVAMLPFSRIVVGRTDPDPRVNGKGLETIRRTGIQVDCGYLEAEITAFNLPFFSTRALDRPFVALKWAQTLDGQLADDLGYSKWISNPISRAYTHTLRHKYDAILVGAGTFLSDLPHLGVRDGVESPTRQPLRIILDPRGRFSDIPSSLRADVNRILGDSALDTVLLSTARPDPQLKGERFHSIRRPFGFDRSALLNAITTPELSQVLGKPLQSILIEGGPTVLSAFLQAGLSDVFHIFTAPKLTGGKNNRVEAGRLLAEGGGFELLGSSILGDDLLTEYISTETAATLSGRRTG